MGISLPLFALPFSFLHVYIDERGLLTEEIDPHVILEENARYSENTQRKVTGDIPVLGFVTPWNSRMIWFFVVYP